MLDLSTMWLLAAQRFQFHINLKAWYHCHVSEAEGWGIVFPKLLCRIINHSLQNHTAFPSLSNAHDGLLRLKKELGEGGEGMSEALKLFENQ